MSVRVKQPVITLFDDGTLGGKAGYPEIGSIGEILWSLAAMHYRYSTRPGAFNPAVLIPTVKALLAKLEEA